MIDPNRGRPFRLIVPLLTLLILCQAARAATLRVPADYATIQAGIDDAGAADTVLVATGLYTGPGNRDLDFGGVDLVLISESGAEETVIDCEGTEADPYRGFLFHSAETTVAVVEGFTIRGGWTNSSDGAGIYCDASSPTIRDCVVTLNVVSDPFYDGGGIYLRASEARIEGCAITLNWATYGAGIACRGGSSPVIVGCTITGNVAGYGGGIDAGGTSSPLILDCVIAGNDATNGFEDPGLGGGLLLGGEAEVVGCTITGNISGFGAGVASWGSSPRLVGCTIAHNDARQYRGGGVAVQYGSLSLERTVLWGNCAAIGEEFIAGAGGTILLACSVYDSTGTTEADGEVIDGGGNLLVDPLFCAPAPCGEAPTTAGDYAIDRGSPCLPENHPCGKWVGARGVGCPAAGIEELASLAETHRLLGVLHPNPAWDRLDFTITLPRAAWTRVEVFDVSGRRVATAIDRPLPAGRHALSWEIRAGGTGRRLARGVYILRLETLGRVESRSFVVAP